MPSPPIHPPVSGPLNSSGKASASKQLTFGASTSRRVPSSTTGPLSIGSPSIPSTLSAAPPGFTVPKLQQPEHECEVKIGALKTEIDGLKLKIGGMEMELQKLSSAQSLGAAAEHNCEVLISVLKKEICRLQSTIGEIALDVLKLFDFIFLESKSSDSNPAGTAPRASKPAGAAPCAYLSTAIADMENKVLESEVKLCALELEIDRLKLTMEEMESELHKLSFARSEDRCSAFALATVEAFTLLRYEMAELKLMLRNSYVDIRRFEGVITCFPQLSLDLYTSFRSLLARVQALEANRQR